MDWIRCSRIRFKYLPDANAAAVSEQDRTDGFDARKREPLNKPLPIRLPAIIAWQLTAAA